MAQYRTLYVGVDVASKENVAALLDEQDQPVCKPLKVANNQKGAELLEHKIVEACEQGKFDKAMIATEATSFYDWHLADFLAESGKLAEFQAEIYRFNPKLVHKFKKALKDMEKTDFVDAVAIAKRLRFGSLPQPYKSQKQYLPLQRLTRYRFRLVKEIVREKGFLSTHLFLKNSSLATEKPIGRTLGKTSRVFIKRYLSPDEVVETPLQDLTDLIVRASKNRIEDPQALARVVKKVSGDAYRIRPGLAKTLDLIMCSCLRSIRAYQKSLKEINKAIADEVSGFQQTLTSVPGIGPVYAAGLIAEIGDVKIFSSSDALAKFAGLWWPRNQSGEFEAQERRMKKTGNKYLRYYLVGAANSMRVHCEEYKAFYQKKYNEVRKHQHKRALVLTARKLVRLVFSLLKSRQLYQKENRQ